MTVPLRRRVAFLLVALAAPAAPVAAQDSAAAVTVRLITIGPGEAVWERFGHNAIWIHDAEAGTDIAYDYGRFSFQTEHFLLRFVQGDMRYWMGQADARALVEFYGGRNRTVTVQTLDLPAEARIALRDFLIWNIEPDHRYYQYDYYRDNCSTRIRDALDRVLGGRLHTITSDTVPRASYRFHTDRLIAPLLWAYLGTKAGLGARTDRPTPRWEEMFVPMKLQEYIRDVTVPADAGGSRPLVIAEDTVFRTTDTPARAVPPRWTPWFALTGVVAAIGLLFLARTGGIAFGAVAAVLSIVVGLGGVALLGLWFLTSHVMTTVNQNVLQLNPLALLTAVLLPWGLAPRNPRAVRALLGGTVVIAAGSLLGLLLHVLPVGQQANGPILGLLLPLHLALPAAVLAAGRRRAARGR